VTEKLTFWIFPALAILFTGCRSFNAPANGGVGNMSGISAASRPVAPFESTQTHGNVRVTLVKLQRGTIFTANTTNIVRDAQPGKTYPIPVLDIAYQVEALGNEPIKAWNTQDEEIAMGTKLVTAVTPNSQPENIIGGSSGSVGPVEGRSTEFRVAAFETQYRVAGVPSGDATVTIKTGFNDNNETFVFANVPLN